MIGNIDVDHPYKTNQNDDEGVRTLMMAGDVTMDEIQTHLKIKKLPDGAFQQSAAR